jgi:hypothetical protein
MRKSIEQRLLRILDNSSESKGLNLEITSAHISGEETAETDMTGNSRSVRYQKILVLLRMSIRIRRRKVTTEGWSSVEFTSHLSNNRKLGGLTSP